MAEMKITGVDAECNCGCLVPVLRDGEPLARKIRCPWCGYVVFVQPRWPRG